jgi:RNA polymerase sigma-54 factor
MEKDAVRDLALEIAEKHLELLAGRDYTRLKNLTGTGDDALRAAQRLILALNPRPGAAFAKVEARYVVPDVVVRKSRNVWRASLNPEAMPRLRINRLYAEIAAGARNAAGPGLSSQLQEARWLIKNVQQRFDTILRVSQAIVERQRHFLEHGEVAMRPLVLREIASTLGLHESTISRVTTQKYMATPRGTFELKYFFGSHVATEAGGAASSTAIRALIKQLVAAEDTRAPLSDARIAQILGEQGIVVARRTIAKYRESLQIPPVNQRKAL